MSFVPIHSPIFFFRCLAYNPLVMDAHQKLALAILELAFRDISSKTNYGSDARQFLLRDEEVSCPVRRLLCPNCNSRTISLWDKLTATRWSPATCSSCGSQLFTVITLLGSVINTAIVFIGTPLLLFILVTRGVWAFLIGVIAFYVIGMIFYLPFSRLAPRTQPQKRRWWNTPLWGPKG